MPHFEMIALDADDTLWHNERLYTQAQGHFVDLLAHYHEPDWIRARLNQTETKNMDHFGYGIKAFALSMIETSVELTEGRISGREIGAIVNLAKEMINARVELIDGVVDAVIQLAAAYPLMIITKGDLLDQERKIDRSGLRDYFIHIEIVSDKTRDIYAQLLARYAIHPGAFVMVGNSLRSDILPVLELGGSAVYIPYLTTWAHEIADLPAPDQPGFYQLETIGGLPALLQQINDSANSENKP
jgi:putative hydrolase of the HAD superfamily